jgi:dTDP-4-dehydrorhamnose reductase
MLDLLVTGAHGQLGRAVLQAASSRELEAQGRDIDTVDITDREAVDKLITDLRPAIVLNCAAFTAVDLAESQEETATRVNADAVAYLTDACDNQGARLVHVSTDYVFPGDGQRPYREADPTGPCSAYGRSKLAGEVAALGSSTALVVRTAWLYGRGGANFVEAIRRQIDGGADRLRVVADQTGCPTFCDDLAEALLDLVAVEAYGLVHAVNTGRTTWHGFAAEIARLLRSDIEIEAVTTDAFPRPAPRPAYSVLDTGRLEGLLGRPMPTWQDGLARYLG